MNDPDRDGVCNDIDNCPAEKNPIEAGETTQADADTDGIGDACDVEQCDEFDHDGDGEFYNSFNDQDKDGFVDCIDLCPTVVSDQTDDNGFQDGDGVGDECEECSV